MLSNMLPNASEGNQWYPMIDLPTFNPLFHKQWVFILQTATDNQGQLMAYKDAPPNRQSLT